MRVNTGFFLSSLVSLSLICGPVYADFPLPPRLSALAYASDYTVGQADLMLPVLGHPNRNNLYIDPALSYGSDNQGAADIGVGYRWIAQQAAILGGYVFGGYSRIDNNARLWVVNPGIEALGSRWDAHLNAYFPMGDRHTNAGSGMNDFFSGHSQFGSLFLVEQFAGNGADAKVAYQLFRDSSLKGYLGSYYFSPAQTNNIWGGAAGVEYWLTQNVKMIGSYTYDNLRHSTYAFGIGLEWGGTRVHRVDPDLEERLTDPVERYLAELGQASKIPSRLKDQSTGGTVLLANNIAFFSQTGTPNAAGVGLTPANCTFENPCGPTDFTQIGVDTLAGLLPNTQLYFNGGTYTSNGAVDLNPGQSLQSRSADYSQPATGAARSTIVADSITLLGNNSLENIILLPSASPLTAGVYVNGSNNVINGSQIGSMSNFFDTGVNASGATVLIINSDVFAGGSSANSRGIDMDMPGNITIQNSRVTVITRGTGVAINHGNVTINNSEIQVNASILSPTGILANSPDAVISVNNTNVAVTNTGGGSADALFNDGTITVTGGALTVMGDNTSQIASGSNPVTIQGGTVCQVNGTTVVCP